MRIEVKFFRVEAWAANNYGEDITQVAYYDNKEEAEEAATQLANEMLIDEVGDYEEGVRISNENCEIIKSYNLVEGKVE